MSKARRSVPAGAGDAPYLSSRWRLISEKRHEERLPQRERLTNSYAYGKPMTSTTNRLGTSQPFSIWTYLAIAALFICGIAWFYKSTEDAHQEIIDHHVRAEQEMHRNAEIYDIERRLMQADVKQQDACLAAAGPQLADEEDRQKIELARLRRIEACVNLLNIGRKPDIKH
jgi:hypothetical protein